MNRIDRAFNQIRSSGRKGVIAYLTAGDPDLEATGQIVLAAAAGGADMVELGVPFSDPVADGPVIQAASGRALKKGVTLKKILSLAGKLRKQIGIPLLLMSYYNPILAYGMAGFVEDASQSGIDGIIVPDLPLEESGELLSALETEGLYLIPFLAPTSSPKRIAETVKVARGFIYCVSVTGVTGVREAIPESARELLARVRKFTSIPLALGFGISGSNQVASLGQDGDAVIIGSAIVKLVEKGGPVEEIAERVRLFINSFKD